MKKEQKRYFLVEYCGISNHVYYSKEARDRVLEELRKYNNRKTSKYIVGNIELDEVENMYLLTAHKYKRLTEKMTISELDDITSKLSERQLILQHKDDIVMMYGENTTFHNSFYPDINIAYFEDKDKSEKDDIVRRIKYIPVIYKDNKQVIDQKFILDEVLAHCSNGVVDLDFFIRLIEEFKFHHVISREIDSLEGTIERVRNHVCSPMELYYNTRRLFKVLILEKNKDGSLATDSEGNYLVSRRRLRDFGFFVTNYNSKEYRKPTEYSYQNNAKKIEELNKIKRALELTNDSESKLTLKK